MDEDSKTETARLDELAKTGISLREAHQRAEEHARLTGITIKDWNVSLAYKAAPTRWQRLRAWIARLWS